MAAKSRGRPSKYHATYAPLMAQFMARLGMIDIDMARELGIAESTFQKWKTDHPEFAKAITRGKEHPDDIVEAALFRRALGYEYVEETEELNAEGDMILTKRYHKHMPSETLASIYWLNNRRSDKWRQRQEVLNTFDDSAKELAQAIRSI